MNGIFNELIEQKIKSFKNDFINSSELFITPEGLKKESSKTPYFHNGEFGGYREAISQQFLKLVVPQRYGISDGFILNNTSDGLSKQCDIVIFDKDTMPLVENNYKQKFYPIESVLSVGEIKSDLTKSQLEKTISNLELVKSFRQSTYKLWIKRFFQTYEVKKSKIEFKDDYYSFIATNKHDYNSDYPYDQIYTFLICKKFAEDLNIDKVIEIITEYQARENTFGINAILSLEDGLLCYHTGEKETEGPLFTWSSYIRGDSLRPLFMQSEEGKIEHIKAFCNFTYEAVSNITIYQPNLSEYFKFEILKDKVKNLP